MSFPKRQHLGHSIGSPSASRVVSYIIALTCHKLPNTHQAKGLVNLNDVRPTGGVAHSNGRGESVVKWKE